MSETKLLRNEGEGTVRVEYAGDVHVFEAGEEREVAADLADSAQYRYSHLGIKIVTQFVKSKPVKVKDAVLFVDTEAQAAEKAAKAATKDDLARAKADARADVRADAAAARADAKAFKATPHPDDLSAEFAPDLPQHPVSTTAEATFGKEIAVDRHEEPAWSPPAENPTQPPPVVPQPPPLVPGQTVETSRFDDPFVPAKPDQPKRKK